jgi:NADH-quinone oxidoreductase subunit J
MKIEIAFILVSFLMLLGALLAAMLRPLIHAVLSLVLAFIGVAMLFVLLGAEFVGLVQVLVYVGAVSVLVVFTVLLTRGKAQGWFSSEGSYLNIGSAIAAVSVFLPLAWVICKSSNPQVAGPAQLTVASLGDVLMGNYIWPVLALGLLLTAALIGAVILVMEEKQ